MGLVSTILTVGHSRHSIQRFIALLDSAQVTAIVDVRSAPASRFSPQFNKKALAASLATRNIAYEFFGKELGGRPEREELYTQGVADYGKMAAAAEFRAGMGRLVELAKQHRVAVMCAEADPLDCHRCLLVGRALAESGREVGHLMPSGEIITQAQAEDRLLKLEGLADQDLLGTARADRLADAYRSRNRKAAYQR
jgi:uncharacterized protein (DUF488 family)